MAEELNNDGVDALAQESNFVAPAQIGVNLYKPIQTAPLPSSIQGLPGGSRASNPTNQIKDATVGSSPNYPSKKSNPTQSGGNWVDALVQEGEAKINSMEDKNAHAKLYAFDSSPTGSFVARYKGYGQETYDKIGFHPLIDNETWYNQNTTAYDDWKRMMTNSAWPMLSLGFMSPINSYASILGKADLGQNTQEALNYDYANQIGYSTKGGFLAGLTNLQLSAAYSVGILLEGALEGALIGAAVGAVEGGLPAIPGAAIGGAAGLFKGLLKLPSSLIQMGKSLGKMGANLKNAAKISEARNMFTNASKTFGEFINPLDNTKNAFMTNVFNNPDDLSNLARTARTVGALWNDAKNLNMALSEGRLEGGFSQNGIYDKLYNDYYSLYGEAPNDNLQKKMMEQAKAGGFSNTIKNGLLVFYSNKLAFPSITKASFLKGMPKFGFGKVIGNVGEEVQMVYTAGKTAAEGVYSTERISMMNAMKGFTKPKTWGRVSLNYFKANLVEGVQEVSQEALADYTEKYYTETFNNPAAKNFMYSMGVMWDATKKQMSAQGAEVFASGFAMGSILSIPGTVKKYMSVGYNKYYKHKDNYEEYVANKEKEATEIVNALNLMTKEGKHLFDPRLNNYVTQMLVGKVVDDPENTTTKQLKDSEFTAFTSAVMTSLRTGTFDMFLDNYAGYKEATPEEIEQAWNLDKGQGQKALQGIDQAIGNAKTISNRYQEARKRMNKMADLTKFKEGTIEYKKAELYNEAYFAGLQNLVFLQSSFDNNLHRLDKLYQRLGAITAIQDSRFSDFAGLTEPGRLNNTIAMLKTEVESAEQLSDPIGTEQAKQKRELLENLTTFQKAQDTLVNAWVNNKALKELKEYMMSTDASLTEEAAEIMVLNQMMDEFENGKENPFLTYKQSYAKLLKTLAGSPEKALQLEREINDMGGMDVLFDELLDTHIIRNENINLSQYVNLLNDPAGFYEHIDKNFAWMQKMYNDREDYYKEIVNAEMSNIEKNEIINTLASQGIFVDLDQFAEWVKDNNNLPDYFIDEPKGMVITKDSILYEEYSDIFMEAARISEKAPTLKASSLKEKLDKRIAELDEARDKDLDEARIRYDHALKQLIGYTEQELKAKEAQIDPASTMSAKEKAELKKEKDLLEKALKQLESLDVQELMAINLVALENGYFTQEIFDEAVKELVANPERLAEAQALAAQFDPNENTQEDISNSVFTKLILPGIIEQKLLEATSKLETPIADKTDLTKLKPYKIYQEEVKSINQRYDKEIENVKDEFKDKGVDENTVMEYSTTTAFEELPEELQAELEPLYAKHLIDIEEDINLKENNPVRYGEIRQRWLETQGSVIKAYNDKIKAEAQKRAEDAVNPPTLKFTPLDYSALNLSSIGITLSNIYNADKQILEVGEYKDVNKNMISLTPQMIADIKSDMKAIEDFLAARAKTYKPKSIAEETIQRIVETVINRQNEIVEKEGETRRFADQDEADARPERATQVAEEVEADLLEKEPYVYVKLKSVVNPETGEVLEGEIQRLFKTFFKANSGKSKSEMLDEFMVAFERKAKSNYKIFDTPSKLKDLRASLEADPTVENLYTTIQQLAHRESTIAGTNIDGLIRDFLTPAVGNATGFKEVKWNPDIMSKEAFDALFHPASGIVSKFRQGMIDGQYMVLSENVKVFDKTLRDRGITGEMDLLAIDKDGNVMIIDIKTGKLKNWEQFGKGTLGDKQTYFRAQQSIYRNLFYNMSGIMPTEIGLLPLAIVTDLDGYVESISVAPIVPKGKDTIELEYLEDVERFGVTPIEPDLSQLKGNRGETETPTEKAETAIPPSDPTKVTLQDNINKAVIFNGQVGKLVILDDGTFAIEVSDDSYVTLEMVRESIAGMLEIERTSYGKPEQVAVLENDLKDLDKQIAATKGKVKLIELYHELAPVKNGELTLTNVGIRPISVATTVSQVSIVEGQTIDAKFDDPNEKTATINGVRYKVNRNATQNIVSLSYNINDARIAEIEEETKSISDRINKLRAKVRDAEDDASKNIYLNEISRAQQEINGINNERKNLKENNPERTLRGENTNNLIFALNSLPNSFQRGHREKKGNDEQKELDSIHSLSADSAIAEAITEILSDHYPDALDTLIEEGVKAVNKGDLLQIELWATETINRLEEFGFGLLSSNKYVTDVSNQVNALNMLLNDLYTIKITKDGKISKQQGEANKRFGPKKQEVQDGSGVSPVQKSGTGSAEGVSPKKGGTAPTEAELREIIKNSVRNTSDQNDFDDINNQPESQELSAVTKKYLNRIEKSKDLDELKKVMKEFIIESINNKNVDLGVLTEAYDEKEKWHNTEVSEGDYVVVTKDFVWGTDDNITEGLIFVVDKITKDGVTVKLHGFNISYKLTDDQLSNFNKITDDMAPEEEIEITQEDVENSEETAANLTDLATKESDLLAERSEAAKNSTDEESFKKLTNKSNLC